jgi:hypothetical protein
MAFFHIDTHTQREREREGGGERGEKLILKFRTLKCNFKESVIQVSNCSLQGYLKKQQNS